ncbi:hypothetical protein APHAL10511_003442 [Amanita phalloides]|nr:hypothetical protein APHAL10511_003442 [Amanita phalloides]
MHSPSQSPVLDDPFYTPTSSRPPSVLRHSPPATGASFPSSTDADASAKAIPSQLRPSTSASVDQGMDAVSSGVRYHHLSRPSTTGSLQGDPPANGAIIIPRTTPTTQQPYIRSLLNSRPLSYRSNTQFSVPSLGTPPSRPKALRMPSHLIPEDVPLTKPWMEKPHPRARIAYFLTYFMLFLGLAGGVVQSYFKYSRAQLDRQPLCLVFEENFDSEDAVFGSNGTFEREVNMDGYGNGEFEMTTAFTNNSYIKNGFLYIVPTLTADNIGWDAVFNGTVYNITGCTFNDTEPNNGYITQNGAQTFDEASYLRSCSAVSNKTAGTVINPVQSARVSTRKTASIKFGRVEVRAKMPNGDWLWPAIWMLPVDSLYGPWPRSGEIDMVESRGNGIRYTARGSNYVQGSLNWGPTTALNSVSKTYSWWSDRRKSFGSEFHTYTMEWTEKFLRIYVDSRLHTLLDISFNKPFFKRGDYPSVIVNGSTVEPLQNPWANGTNATPFDQEFYLIMNVAVGSTNGWFPDWQGNKPWINSGTNPMLDFARAHTEWYRTWPTNPADRGLVVDYVKMWKHCDGK